MALFLSRFYEPHRIYFNTASRELMNGKKVGHWMWFMFPQLRGLGQSAKSSFYGLSGIHEAREFYNDSRLGPHLIELSKILLDISVSDPSRIFPPKDVLKLRSCMTLFEIATRNKVFKDVLVKYYGGERDDKTIEILESGEENWED